MDKDSDPVKSFISDECRSSDEDASMKIAETEPEMQQETAEVSKETVLSAHAKAPQTQPPEIDESSSCDSTKSKKSQREVVDMELEPSAPASKPFISSAEQQTSDESRLITQESPALSMTRIFSSSSSPHRRIVNAYKRRAALKHSPLKKPKEHKSGSLAEAIGFLCKKPEETVTTFPDTFTRGRVTVRRIETLLEPKPNAAAVEAQDKPASSIEAAGKTQNTEPGTSTSTDSQKQLSGWIEGSKKSRALITFFPSPAGLKPPKVPNGVNEKTFKFVPKLLRSPLRKLPALKPAGILKQLDNHSKLESVTQCSPQAKILSKEPPKIRLQKLSNGSYGFLKPEEPPQSTQKAYAESQIVKKAVGKSQDRQVNRNSSFNRPVPTTSKVTPAPRNRYSSSSDDETTSHSKRVPRKSPAKSNVPQSRSASLLSGLPIRTANDGKVIYTAVTLPCEEEPPEPFKYSIPQDMILSTYDKIKVVEKQSTRIKPNPPSSSKTNDLFVMEDDSNEAPTSLQPKARRKATLIPRQVFDEDTNIEFQAMPRPKVNEDLIDELAKNRVMVSSLLKKLNMPEIDFDAESDDYINLYKLCRN